MAADTRRQLTLLGGLLAVLLLVTWWQFGGTATPGGQGATGGSGRTPAAPVQSAGTPAQTPEQILARGLGLERLDEDRPAPEATGRDPFRTGSSTSAGGRDGTGGAFPVPIVPTPVQPVTPVGPVGPPPPPPIAVRFIGIVSRRDVGKVAVLSDGKNVYYGREGEIVDGRWRIVSIGEESLQIEHADGRGRQTLRLTG